MFNTRAHHGDMVTPKPVRAAAGEEHGQIYERTDESSKPRPVSRGLAPAPGFEELPTSYDASDEGIIPTTWSPDTTSGPELAARPVPVAIPGGPAAPTPVEPPGMELRPAPEPPTWQPRPAPPAPQLPAPEPLAPYDPVPPSADPSEGAEPPVNGGAPIMNGEGGYMNGGSTAMPGGGGAVPGGAPAPNGAMVPGTEAGFPGQTEGPLVTNGQPAGAIEPFYTQPWFWGLAAAGLAGVGVLYYMRQQRQA